MRPAVKCAGCSAAAKRKALPGDKSGGAFLLHQRCSPMKKAMPKVKGNGNYLEESLTLRKDRSRSSARPAE